MHLDSTGAWWLLGICAVLVVIFLLVAHFTQLKTKIPRFYSWIGAIAIFGGALAFLLPIALNSGFGKDDDGPVLRQLILYTTGGLLGVITLGETHRKNNQEKEKNENDHTRQVYAERRSRYTKAVEQLANEKAAVRLGGIYTLVGLADEWLADDSLTKDKQNEEGQVIINNLCSYIRSPFPLAAKIEEYEAHKELEKLQKSESGKLSEEESLRLQILIKRFEDSDEYEKPKDITTDYAKFHEEQDVRRTIFVEMSKRSSTFTKNDKGEIIETVPGIWSDFDFDFSRAPIFYSLSSLTIEKGNFSSAKFYSKADFSGATFTQNADFSKATFTQNANFSWAKFTQDASFSGATFTQNANFSWATFAQNANFSWAKFNKIMLFDKATFNNEAHFGEATFNKLAGFGETVFNNEAHFSKAIFNKGAYFGETTFNHESRFGETLFRDIAHFVKATFTGNVDFGGAEFSERANFWGAEFSGDADFKDSYFAKYAPIFADDSSAARFSNRINWADSNFSVHSRSQPINPGDATLDGKTFRIPLGTVVFSPDSWNEESKKYIRISDPAK
ncbi:pentapeptide repeat-containing protein [Rothia sp. HMSC066G02]|uniref:pentapeptide repeat-containing protein n=1 Tax=Rothia sp. HMSC066G02 TaxID=1739398 RepID=UPI0008A40FCA|nr:pentapeptide repeat-containing protein [Rothia sp. HMSC066G02]OFR26505.1 hypothetical protein HMPREF2894_07885 [Rothia sp. HMSC066G02]